MDLKDEKVVLTGATGGIGSALSQVLANAGAKLILIARTSEKLELLLTKLQGQGHKYYAFDFTRVDETEDLCKKIIEENDHIDILINAAGVGIYKNIEDVEYREWQDSMAINVTAPFFLTKSLLPLLKKSEKSVIINIGSGMGKIPTACRSVYCATKYALRGMTMSLAAEFKNTNIHFIHIALGSTLTEFGPMTLEEKKEENLKGKAYFTPEWVAKKFVEILKNDDFQEEIEIYPSDYKGKEEGAI
ncbi:hypothetical protein A3A76_03755 [Candidatus Woesebacteria bacterium RIFCSPLOWO2_01_FULL_39_23]|uniref:Short-chain dehydrogenase n=1 Tax=Candidatus Woesebacteria bacterium RIFCSPHIGHO2_01_FULL_40_22 TaxID=1802499 RepID=A0A1F7YL09_9BACT|nr:MAG: hypothetical protein A2141_00270 [Candidatus Woesebacteria bacterium RBG_16_40_11]OGM27569.1 MAG: hypothetical protein A2628_02155 [Candidatus Woesebacteria bacterium RIFCSPHIGHO2_01_FULL_40_22]OGM36723.1 MAG: hypothetical protein A3E41_03000 [Candidatus Woesebacteria bacterium RIFCSPHIGHO2_12_FULL_38_9]OGM62743.1 MAG: hypothetical protein A3A76_03755 [Candidatus Woesebacteria bacterium RIFCSPLOWO2_01_FULL_39_23]